MWKNCYFPEVFIILGKKSVDEIVNLGDTIINYFLCGFRREKGINRVKKEGSILHSIRQKFEFCNSDFTQNSLK